MNDKELRKEMLKERLTKFVVAKANMKLDLEIAEKSGESAEEVKPIVQAIETYDRYIKTIEGLLKDEFGGKEIIKAK